LGFTGVSSGVFALGCVVFFVQARAVLLQQVRERLMSIASVAVASLDPQTYAAIDGDSSPPYLALKGQLQRYTTANPDLRWMYTLEPPQDGSAVWTFGLDTTPKGAPLYSPPGLPYDMSQELGMQDTFHRGIEGAAASERIYTEEYGSWLSGVAPLRDGGGRVLAVVGADISASTYFERVAKVRNSVFLTFGVGLLICLGSSVLFARRIADPYEVLEAKQAAELIRAEAEANRAKGLLARYVSPRVADLLLRDDPTLGTVRRLTLTVMFTDLREFTRLSEELSPENTVALLNRYFERMVGVAFSVEGTLDKYMGDGLMVLFGAPVQQEDHAWRALRAALEMRRELENLNGELDAQGLQPLRIGIGLHTGECVVGSIGAEQRLDFTAIGDTVNTASRIEGLTKAQGVDILLSAETLMSVQDRVAVRPLGPQAIRGRKGKLEIYVLDGLAPAGGTAASD
jgi:adenylate cyclase